MIGTLHCEYIRGIGSGLQHRRPMQIMKRFATPYGTQGQQATHLSGNMQSGLLSGNWKHTSGRKIAGVGHRRGYLIFGSTLFTGLLAAFLLHRNIIHLQPNTCHPRETADARDVDCCCKHMLHITDLKCVM